VRRFTLGQAGKYALVECPYFGSPLELIPAVRALREAGITSIVAHPERNPDVAERPGRVSSLVELGALVQLTAASVEGTLGRSPRETAFKLLDLHLAHLIASDAHGPHIRESGLAAAADAVGEEELAQYLTEAAPAAILAGESVSAPPRRRQRRRFLRF
jgi:protein-tyrosine phosphatase